MFLVGIATEDACFFSGLNREFELGHLPIESDWSPICMTTDGRFCRGRTMPGLWHCYVAVFDGGRSTVWVDGREEITPNDAHSCGYGLLDGITIGSDHGFDMSLGLGLGEEGEGEGAISELIIFKGRLPNSDINTMEDYLMTKHGISNCSDLSQHQLDTIAQEENWRIMAEILYSEENDDRYALTIPLRILARYRTVDVFVFIFLEACTQE